MFRIKYLVLLAAGVALCLAVGTQAQADLLLSDSFNTTADPGGLNDELSTRQSGAWKTTNWDPAAASGVTINVVGDRLSISGTSTTQPWNDAYLHNNGTALVGSQYTVAAKVDFTSAYDEQGAVITVKNDQDGEVVKTGSLFCDFKPTGATNGNFYWELLYYNGSAFQGTEGTVAGGGKTSYNVSLQINETAATKTCALVVDGSTLYTLNYDMGSTPPANRYVGLGYNGLHGGTLTFDDFGLTQVPEPATCSLAVIGVIGLLAYAWRKRK